MPWIMKSHPRIDIMVRIEKYQLTCLNLISASSALFLSGWSCNDSFLYALLISEEPLACEINFSMMKSVLIISHSYKRTPIILTHQTTHIDSLLMLWLYFQPIPLSSYSLDGKMNAIAIANEYYNRYRLLAYIYLWLSPSSTYNSGRYCFHIIS